MRTNKNRVFFLIFFGLTATFYRGYAQLKTSSRPAIVCNPINLNYRFALEGVSRREAADPTAINFKGEFYLFASKSGGYWHSTDLVNWNLITTKDLPLEDYAPTAVVMRDTIFFVASSGKNGTVIYKSGDPKSGKWKVANPALPINLVDPDLFLDTDGRLYLYYGCSNVDPIRVVELDTKSLMPLNKPVDCFVADRTDHGWERFGEHNDSQKPSWIEGAWMTKHNGKYYLQYACPGTEFKSYADGLYIADHPLGPFRLASDNPFSSKQGGFICGAGHSSTFQDNYGNFWRISTMSISVKHRWERRLGLFPAFFEGADHAYTYTGFGDFPMIIPHKRISSPAEIRTGQMLLSYHKPVTTSSQLEGHQSSNAADEDIRTYWSAATGKPGEWLQMDLQHACLIKSFQVNFAEQGSQILGRSPGIYYRYTVKYSTDGKNWNMLTDKSANLADKPHDFIILPYAVHVRFLRITNLNVPDGKFAISDFRVFGNAQGMPPSTPSHFHIERDQEDRCIVHLSWQHNSGITGYNIRYGTASNRLYQNYLVYGKDSLTIRNLNKNQPYFFTIDCFNENGVRRGTRTLSVK